MIRVFALLLPAMGAAQTLDKPPSAHIEGAVVSDADGSPLRRARVTLQGLEAGLGSTTVEADDHGVFSIRNIVPGQYALIARRDGYLDNSTPTRTGLRMPHSISITDGQALTEIGFRMRPWGVLSGKILYEDGEPAVNVRVELFREAHLRGRSQFRQEAAMATNDRGEYRIFGLPPGAYFVAADSQRTTSNNDQPDTGYATTFFPDTFKLSEAAAVRVEYGKELNGVDIFLKPVRRAKLHGRVVSGLSGAAIRPSSVLLERMDAHNNGSLPAPVAPSYDKDSNFEIKGIVAGTYRLWAETTESNQQLVARRIVTVADDDVDSLDMVALPEQAATFELKMEGGASLPTNFPWRLLLEPRSERSRTVETRPPNGNVQFKAQLMAEELYDLFLPNTPNDAYLAAIRVSGTDVLPIGLAGSQGGDQTIDIVLDSRGGRIQGRAFSGQDDAQGGAMSGSTVMLIPDPPTGRLQHYRETQADEYAQFQLRGVAPGKYTLVAWLDDAPCDVYDEQALDACRAVGTPVSVEQSSQQIIVLNMRR